MRNAIAMLSVLLLLVFTSAVTFAAPTERVNSPPGIYQSQPAVQVALGNIQSDVLYVNLPAADLCVLVLPESQVPECPAIVSGTEKGKNLMKWNNGFIVNRYSLCDNDGAFEPATSCRMTLQTCSGHNLMSWNIGYVVNRRI